MKRIFILLSALALSVGTFAQLQQGVYDESVFVEYEEMPLSLVEIKPV